MNDTLMAFFSYLMYITIISAGLLLKKDSIHLFREKNLRRGSIILLGVVLFYCHFGMVAAITLFFSIYIINEIIVYFFGRDLIWNKDSCTFLFYTLPDTFTDISSDPDNKSEACYDEEHPTPKEAQINRFKKVVSILGLKPGHRLLDIGCGEGELVEFCKQRGIEAAGITYVQCQADRAQKRGLNVICGSYHDLFKEFCGKFDVVTFIGPLEHAAPHGHHIRSKALVKSALTKIFSYAQTYLDPKSPIRQIFTSTLHVNPAYYGALGTFILSRAYGGAYPVDAEGERIYNIDDGTLVHVSDHTEDYFLATVNQDDHFGHTQNGNIISYIKALMLFPIYPLIIYILLYDFFGYWMWHFDGRIHAKRNYTFNENGVDRPATLYWSSKEYF